MKQPNNKVTIILIIASVILLLIFQAVWLRRSYRDELYSIQREARILFRNTLFEMNDSLMQKSIHSIDSIPADNTSSLSIRSTGRTRRFATRYTTNDTFKIRTGEGEVPPMHFHDTSANVRVFVYSGNGKDTIKNYLRPLMSRIGRNHRSQNFSIRLTGDTLKTSDVEREFHMALVNSGIEMPINAIKVKRVFPLQIPDYRPEHVIFTPSGGFRAEFGDLTWTIIKNISPQILFSLFLTLLTTGSFIILYRSIRTQQRLMELKNDFISNITHELKTPVTTVGVAIEALRSFKGLDNPQLTSEYLDIAQNELNRLTLLTDKILKSAIFENKGVAFVPELLELDKVVDRVLVSMKLVFDKQQASVHFEKDGNNFQLRGGSAHLTSVIFNLLDNAMKYSLAAPEISIILKEGNDHFVLAVKDNGVGIPPEYRKKIFEKFFRVPAGDVHNAKGHGLGLSYVESVVKAHGGTIAVDSSEGRGSTFTIVLPK